MNLAYYLTHLFLPSHTNNFKAKTLHAKGLIAIALVLVFSQSFLHIITFTRPGVLGYAANISPAEVIKLTNVKREENGLSDLVYSGTLAKAAHDKGVDMITKGYWAHVSPDGVEPWFWFQKEGYKYKYAGENLARDFSNPGSAVDAWMASPSHRENMLSPKYKEIGVAVVEGNVDGVDTTIIVQLFGTKATDTVPAVPVVSAKDQVAGETAPNSVPSLLSTQNVNPLAISRGVALGLVMFLMTLFVVDAIIITRRNVVRVGGRSFAHISFLGMILAIIIIARAGRIL